MKPLLNQVIVKLVFITALALSNYVHADNIKNGVKHLNAIEAQALLNENSQVQVLDVRTAKEFKRGHIKGAINIDYYADDFAKQLSALDPDVEYLVHCHSGVRSGRSLSTLKSAGVTKLFHLDGGIKAWLSNDLALE